VLRVIIMKMAKDNQRLQTATDRQMRLLAGHAI